MNISRRALLGGAVAVVVTPVAAPIVPVPPPTWTPQPWAFAAHTQTLEGEIFYGGARGGGKMFALAFRRPSKASVA